jgi:hypothetical protein
LHNLKNTSGQETDSLQRYNNSFAVEKQDIQFLMTKYFLCTCFAETAKPELEVTVKVRRMMQDTVSSGDTSWLWLIVINYGL